MSLVLSARLASPEARSGLFYLTMFASGGAAVTYLPIWLSLQGITEAQIGVINALPILVMMVLNLVVGRIADRAKDWRSVIIIGCMATAVASVGLLFVSGFWAILLFWTLTVLPMAATGPVVDAAVMRLTRRRGSDFGVIRAWGTVGFMTFNALAGVFAAWWGPAFFIPLFVGLSVLRAVASLYLPLFRAPEPSASDPKPLINPLIAQRLREVMKPWFLLPLFGMAMVFGIHMMIGICRSGDYVPVQADFAPVHCAPSPAHRGDRNDHSHDRDGAGAVCAVPHHLATDARAQLCCRLPRGHQFHCQLDQREDGGRSARPVHNHGSGMLDRGNDWVWSALWPDRPAGVLCRGGFCRGRGRVHLALDHSQEPANLSWLQKSPGRCRGFSFYGMTDDDQLSLPLA
jgi:hypothetical protein